MNLFQLVLKQMRQRALGTWLTLLSVLLGVALATATIIAYREGGKVFGQTDYGYDVIVGPRGSPLQLTINTVYHLDKSPGNIPYSTYEALANPRNPQVKIAVPYAVGDTYKGRRIVATLPKLFGFDDQGKPLAPERVIEYRPGKRYTIAQGRPFHPLKFEAVLGADAARETGLKVGDKFKATHGNPAAGQVEDVHEEQWEVVGILAPTRTANDGILFIPLVSFYTIQEHEEGLKAHQALREAMSGGAAAPGRPTLPGRPTAPVPGRQPAPAPAPAPTTRPAAEQGHGHDHDHDHDHDTPKTTAPAAPADKDHAHEGHDHDHDHAAPSATTAAVAGKDDGHADHDHAAPSATTAAVAGKDDGHADHDHDHAAPSTTPAAVADKDDDHDDHAGHAHERNYHLESDGTIHLELPKEAWEVSAVLVKARAEFQATQLMYMINNAPLPVMAVNPASEMRAFFETFLKGSQFLLLALSALVTVVAAVSILVSIYNSVSARRREIAIMRALGATRGKNLALICLEAGLIGLVGGILGLVAGHLLAGVGAIVFERVLGERIDWFKPDAWEWVYLGGVVVVAVLAGLVPGLKAYRTPVATNLVAA